MKSITEIYRQGMGPNSTLNMVPYQACADVAKEIHLKRIKVGYVEVVFYNEYSRLGEQSGVAIDIEFAFAYSNFKYVIKYADKTPACIENIPYVFDIIVHDASGSPLFKHRVVAKGGAEYAFFGKPKQDALPFETFNDVKKWFKSHPKKTYIDFCELADDKEAIRSIYYRGVNLAEIACLQGLRKHGPLKLPTKKIHYVRMARNIWLQDESYLAPSENATRIITSFAYAISEEIAEKRVIISAPSLCTTSVLWSIILYLQSEYDISAKTMINAFCAAGIFASLMDKNASIAPIDAGCQGPMGAACGMAAVVCAVVLYDADIEECGRVFEMALEHTLGVICDSLNTFPIIPCIQRCASYAVRAFELATINHGLMSTPELCKLDDIFTVINETGKDLISKNRRLSIGGFAQHAKYSLKKPNNI